MSDANFYDPRHGHERRDPNVKPILDEEGRCLRCVIEYQNGALATVITERDALAARVALLEAAVRDYVINKGTSSEVELSVRLLRLIAPAVAAQEGKG